MSVPKYKLGARKCARDGGGQCSAGKLTTVKKHACEEPLISAEVSAIVGSIDILAAGAIHFQSCSRAMRRRLLTKLSNIKCQIMFMQVGAVQARQNIKMALCDTVMNSLRQFPLGAVFPESPHAVVCSLPTMADVCGYEEKDARVLNALKSGYRVLYCTLMWVNWSHIICDLADLLNHRGLLVRGAHFALAIVSEYAGKGKD